MTKDLRLLFQQKAVKRLLFGLSIFVLLYWITGWYVPVYDFKLAGILFEILWFPVILLTFLIPAAALTAWIHDRFNFRSVYLYILAAGLASVLFLFLS